MAETPYRRARRRLAAPALFLASLAALSPAGAAEPLRDVPIVWFADDRADVPAPEPRDPNLLWDQPRAAFVRPFGRHTRPSRLLRRARTLFGGEPVREAANVNRLDEVPTSSWFTNRIGLFPMSPEEAARGAGTGEGPSTFGPWTIIGAKTEGVTPGFNVEDVDGARFLVKFDSPRNPNVATAAGAVSARILHAAGYNVPDDAVVYFRRDRLVLGEDVRITLPGGTRRPMTEADIDEILSRVHAEDGTWRAISSRFLEGRPLGPFDYAGRRDDDPNDRIDHEHRRELRGLSVFAAWLAHFDTKQHNTLDMYVEEGGRRFVRHHLIDFASTLGTGAYDVTYRWGFEHTVDLPPVLGRILGLGFNEDTWRRLERPEGLPEVGMWESEVFDPMEFKPLNPNTAFAHRTRRDGYWGAKIVSAFTDAQLLAIAEEARYEDPEATRYVARILAERRDAIARAWFDEVSPLDFFAFDGEVLTFHDLGAERGIYPGMPARYAVGAAAVTPDRERAGEPRPQTVFHTAVALDDAAFAELREAPEAVYPFFMFEVRVDRGEGFGAPVRAYVARASHRVVAVDR